MTLAQRLYEGVELGDDGPVGLITYMRTDSTRLSDDAVAEARGFISEAYGTDYLPAEPNVYKSKKGGAGRPRGDPADLARVRPETVRPPGPPARAAGATRARARTCSGSTR